MKSNHKFILIIVLNFILSPVLAQTPIVGTGSFYSSIFPNSTPVTYDVPGVGLVSVNLSNGSLTGSRGLWDLTAQGGGPT